jgi:hypothetical protein
MYGAAVMYFRLPTSQFFDEAFIGAKAWYERGYIDDPLLIPAQGKVVETVRVDKPDKTSDGFTLVTTTRGSLAKLLDMRGAVVHQWELPFHEAYPHPPHVSNPLPDNQIQWFRCHLYGNGDLLAIYHALGDTPYGYGLIKLTKDSKLLWAYPGNAHHDLDVAEDGTIYTLVQKIVSKPPLGLDYLPSPLIADSLVVLSPQGQELDSIPILEAFRDSSYALLMKAALDMPPIRDEHALVDSNGDLVHANSVKVLSRARALKFPLFQPGQVLISLRSLHIIAVLDIPTRSVVWAARGVWQTQHDAEFLDNGHLLLYDNTGSNNGSRILEYDPQTQAIAWAYSNENVSPFRAVSRGMKQRLPNGNTLLVDPDDWLLREVTANKELVWETRCSGVITGARRYAPNELTFLKGDQRARP